MLDFLNSFSGHPGLDDAVPEFYSNPHNDCSISENLVDTSNFLGNYCEKLNINKSLLHKILDENDANMPKVVLANGALLEIEAFCQKRNLKWKHLSRIVLFLSDVCYPSHITADFLRHRISALQKQKRILLLAKTSKIMNWNNFYVHLLILKKMFPKLLQPLSKLLIMMRKLKN